MLERGNMKQILLALLLIGQFNSLFCMNWFFKKDYTVLKKDLADLQVHLLIRKHQDWELDGKNISKAPERVQLGIRANEALTALNKEKARFQKMSGADKLNFAHQFSYTKEESKIDPFKKTLCDFLENLQKILFNIYDQKAKANPLKELEDKTKLKIKIIKRVNNKLEKVLLNINQNQETFLAHAILVHLKQRKNLLIQQGLYELKSEKISLIRLDTIPEDQRNEIKNPDSEIRKNAEHHRISSIEQSNNSRLIQKRNSKFLKTLLLDKNGELISDKTLQFTFPHLKITDRQQNAINELNLLFKKKSEDCSPTNGLIEVIDKLELMLGYTKPKKTVNKTSPTEDQRISTEMLKKYKEKAEQEEQKQQQIKEQEKKGIKRPAYFKKNPKHPNNSNQNNNNN